MNAIMKRNLKTSAESGVMSLFSFSEWKEMQKENHNKGKGGYDKVSCYGFMKKYSFCVSLSLVLLVISYYSSVFLHAETYVWQSTVLANYIRPVNRSSCLPSLSFPRPALPKLNITITYLYDNNDGSWDESLMSAIIENRKRYCQKHGYTLINGNQYIDRSRPTAWSKLLVASHIIQDFHYDYIFYIDMDIVIMNMNIRVEDFIQTAKEQNPSTPAEQQDFIMTGDWNGPNTGVWIAKSTSSFASWFFNTAWKEGAPFANQEKSVEGIPYPFEYEQRVFQYLLNTDKWQSRGLPPYRAKVSSTSSSTSATSTTITTTDTDKDSKPYTSDQIRTHFTFLPQCAFNSYSIHPFSTSATTSVFNSQGLRSDVSATNSDTADISKNSGSNTGGLDRETSQYVEGDFIIHFAGKKEAMKTNMLKHYLQLAAATRGGSN